MDGKRLIRTLRLRNLLSYGPASETIRLEPLNVLIGPNASGKSNLVEALALLASTPKDLTAPIREGGGVREWLWKRGDAVPAAEIEATIGYPRGIPYQNGTMPLRYRLSFAASGQRLEIVEEVVENEHPTSDAETDVYFFYRFQSGHPVLNIKSEDEAQGPAETAKSKRSLRREELNPEQSILSQRKDPDQLPEITYIGAQFEQFGLFREWNLGRYTALRTPQPADLPGDFLLPNAGNLGLVLNDLEHRAGIRRLIVENLKRFYEAVEDVTTKIQGGTVQVFVHEQGIGPIPAVRLSDGTLRYLCLLTVLCHPSPPPLLCIEEPELGLHPDILPTIADLLIEASKNTQLIVTTHSDTLVSALSEVPEAVLVCEHGPDGTELRRLEPDRLRDWLEKYSLGELWRMGEIGGNRW